ncbi:hypothetical protein H4219_005607 [Mycoemilia scoparia]|uniref:Uncharacterized protein n=1 Tax=Mycoemilia scoparia TaxID=417184 RepID=A0A9W7ZM98_9FUNG|nr:hypothetical protein H4219_005607 [Mycoemilia scoparia]
MWNEYTALLTNRTLHNYAVAGAVSSNNRLFNSTFMFIEVPSLLDQIDHYLKSKSRVEDPENALVNIEIGSNNLLMSLNKDDDDDDDDDDGDDKDVDYVDANQDRIASVTVKNIINGAQRLVDEGGFSQFLVWNIPPLWKAPTFNIGGKNRVEKKRKVVESVVTKINRLLEIEFNKFISNNHKKLKFAMIHDFHRMFKMLLQPNVVRELGITDTTTNCVDIEIHILDSYWKECPNRQHHFFLDTVHPTAKVHYTIGALVERVIATSSQNYDEEFIIDVIRWYGIRDASFKNNIVVKSGVKNEPGFKNFFLLE